jgi:hypothetical protein
MAIIIVFPPWLYYDGNTSNQRSAGYHFLFCAPGLKSYEEMFGFSAHDTPTQVVAVKPNIIRLIVQILSVFFLFGGIDLKLQYDRAWVLVTALGICGVLLLVLLTFMKF